ncbi:MAG TPA: penicillin-binding transpeptidase domain-containing protein [Symbiobacteriaceae bacterium]
MLRTRAMFLRLMVLLVMAGLTGRMVWVQAVRAGENLRRGEQVRLEKRPVQPIRGAIVDKAGRYFAMSGTSHTVVANVTQMPGEKEMAGVAAALAPLINQTPAALLAKFKNPGESPGHLVLASGLDLKQAQKIQALRLTGIVLEQKVVRTYPQGAAASQVIGYLDDLDHGKYGLEASYDKQMGGKAGSVTAEFTDGGTPIENTIKATEPSVPGANLVVSLDVALQQLVEQKLDAALKANDAKRALAIAMDVHTGEIILMAMRPGADLAKRGTWGDFSGITNWSIYNHLSPGSIFKPITTSIALQENAITLSQKFMDPGQLVRSGKVIHNWDDYVPPTPAPLTIAELLQRSSNVGLIQVGETYPRETFVKYLDSFGLRDKTGIDLVGEDEPFYGSDWKDKREIDWANMYIGQHLEVTPIQMITAEAAIANGGYLVQPHVVREIRNPEGQVVWTAPTEKRRQVISQTTAKEVQDLMFSVVEKGTASLARTPGYTVAGKTGTAQKFDEHGQRDRNLADFIGFAPATNPQVIMLVMVDEPTNPGYGGQIAAPLFAQILPHVMRSVGIMPDSDAARGQEKAPPKVVTGVMPNVVWLPVAKAQERLAQAGYTFKLDGTGDRVAAQSVKPGSTAKSGTEVELKLAPGVGADGTVHVPDFTGLSLAEASQLATDVGLTLKASGSGFVAAQEPSFGGAVAGRSTLSVRLAPH